MTRHARTVVVCLQLVLTPVAAAAQLPEVPGTQRPAVANPVTVYPDAYTARWIDDADFVYGPRLLDFDLAGYLRDAAPHLVPYAEFISHWCAFYSISPKVLLTVIEMRSGAVTNAAAMGDPFAGRASGAGFEEQVRWTLAALYEDYYAYRAAAGRPGGDALNASTYALLTFFRGTATPAAFAAAAEPAATQFAATMARLFPPKSAASPDLSIDLTPVGNFLQLPFKNGVSWWFGGVHTTSGSDPGVMSSLDFTGGVPWGGDTSTKFVAAAHAGKVTVHSTCAVTVTSPTGWSTFYYHLASLQVTNNQEIAANHTLGVYASTFAQATCQGGTSGGPHVHFSLLFNGEFSALDGVSLSGYLVHPGRRSYETDRNFMWLEKNGTKYWANTGSGELPILSSAPIVPTVSINDVSVTEGNSGTRNATFTLSLSQAATAAATVNYATADGTATSGLVRSNTTSITIPSVGAGSLYPSNIDTGSGSGVITTKVVATLSNYSHVYPGDVGALLVAPTGQKVWLMSGIGSGNDAVNANLTFDDAGVSMPLMDFTPVTGTYKPTVNPGGSQLPPAPAPLGPYASTMAAFNGVSPFGVWKLYVYDGAAPDTGVVAGGWTLNITTNQGTLDYVSASGTVNIAQGASSQTVSVVVSGDTAMEPNETFLVNLSSPSGVTLADAQGVATIVTDDVSTLTINDVTLSEGDSGTRNATFTISVAPPSTSPVSFRYVTGNNSATAGADYMALDGGATLVIGATSITVNVVINGDTTREPTENFVLNLSNPENAVIGDPLGVGTILNDDFVPFTDPTLTARATSVRAIHIMELRTRINAVRAARGVGVYQFTDPDMTARQSLVKATHILQMRAALVAAYAAAGLVPPAYSDLSLGGVIRAVHLTELRFAVGALE